MGAVFAFASGPSDIETATPDAVATGMQVTFLTAAILILVALALTIGSRALANQKRRRAGSLIAPELDPLLQ